MKRVLIVGTTGSGKTTLGLKLSPILGIQAYDLDDLYWLPEWKTRSPEEFHQNVVKVIEQEKWIISGNFKAVRDMIVQSADTIVWLDYSFCRNLWQILRRSYLRVKNQTLVCNGNREKLSKLLSKDSIILWFFQTFRDKRRKYQTMIPERERAGIRCVRLRSPLETKKFLEKISNSGSS